MGRISFGARIVCIWRWVWVSVFSSDAVTEIIKSGHSIKNRNKERKKVKKKNIEGRHTKERWQRSDEPGKIPSKPHHHRFHSKLPAHAENPAPWQINIGYFCMHEVGAWRTSAMPSSSVAKIIITNFDAARILNKLAATGSEEYLIDTKYKYSALQHA